MTQVKAYAPGLYPGSGTRGREEVRSFLTVQQESGMDYFSNGLLDWRTLEEPLSREAESEGLHHYASEMPRGRWFPTLPSPLLLSRSAGLDVSEAADSVSAHLGDARREGCAFAVLQQSQMPDTAELKALGDAMEASDAPPPLVLRLPPGDAAGILQEAAELPVEALGVDMISTGAEDLPEPFPKTLLAGVVDAADPRIEEPTEVAARYENLLGRLADESDLHLAQNGDLRALVPEAAARKVRTLGDAARVLRGG